MADVLLTTLNARYSHAAFGLRYLMANLAPERRARAKLVEMTVHDDPAEVAEQLLAETPRVIGVGVYIWNVRPVTEVVAILKRVAPEITVVLGGPEVSYRHEAPRVTELADHVVQGEGDLAFDHLVAALLVGDEAPKWIEGGAPALGHLASPYPFYTDEDIAQRVVYVEASRGCPFQCAFCLSALDAGVRQRDVDDFLADMNGLWRRGARQFKFVDRTFNLKADVGRRILEFFLERYEPGTFLHFEMIPDRLPEALREPIARFPAGALQFEIGIQSFDPETCADISRRQSLVRLEDNLRFLREQTGVHLHTDLIAGLPGEDLDSFGRGFDRLVALGPHEIQVGILKRLRGAPIARHDERMVYSPEPPYEVLRTDVLSFEEIRELTRLARVWDRVANSGRFRDTLPRLWQDTTPFAGFRAFSARVFEQTGRSHSIALERWVRLLFDYLTGELGHAPGAVAETLAADYTRDAARRLPRFIREHLRDPEAFRFEPTRGELPSRQRRHAI